MKFRIMLLTLIMMFSTQTIFAGSISDVYNAGDTLTAAKMDNIKNAVNDNDSNVNANIANITANANAITILRNSGLSVVQGNIWVTIPTTVGELMSITFTAPSSGAVIIEASGTVAYSDSSGASGGFYCLDLSDTTADAGGCTPNTGSRSAIRSYIPAGMPNMDSGLGFGYSIREVVNVISGASYTWYLNGRVSGTDVTAFLFHPVLTALFVPDEM